MAKYVNTKKKFGRLENLRYSKIKKFWCVVNNCYFIIDSQVCQKFRSDYYSDHKKK